MKIPSIRARRASGARVAGSARSAERAARTRRGPARSNLLAAAAAGVVVALLLWGAGTAATSGAASRPDSRVPAVHRVEMRGFAFVPAELSGASGDTVVWVNADPVPHTATSVDDSWDTGTVAAGDSARVVVQRPGSYVCTFHPSMTGALVATPR